MYDSYKQEHEKFLMSDFNSASKVNLEIMIDNKQKLELSQIDERIKLQNKWDEFKIHKDTAIQKYCKFKRMEKRVKDLLHLIKSK